MALNIKIINNTTKIKIIAELYKETVEQLDAIAKDYGVQRIDIIRHAINNVIDAHNK